MKFSKRVRKLRSQLCITQQDLAAALGVTMMTVSRWERGLNKPRGELLKRFAKIERTSKLPKDFSRGVRTLIKKSLDAGVLTPDIIAALPKLSERERKAVLKGLLAGV